MNLQQIVTSHLSALYHRCRLFMLLLMLGLTVMSWVLLEYRSGG